jgi:hypothetical protein
MCLICLSLLPYATRLKIARLKILHVCKCLCRSGDQLHGVLELISNCYELSKAIDIEPYKNAT